MVEVSGGYELDLHIRIIAANKIGLTMSVDYELHIENREPEVY